MQLVYSHVNLVSLGDGSQYCVKRLNRRRNLMKKILALIVVCFLAIASVSGAQGFAPWMDVMKQADKDNDGRLSPNELMYFENRDHYLGFQPFMADHFPKFDFDGDGFLSFKECREGMEMAGYSDDEVMQQFTRDFGFRPWDSSKGPRHRHRDMK